MKRFFKICTLTGAGLFVMGLGMTAFGLHTSGGDGLKSGETGLSGKALENAAKADSLDIELTAGNLRIVPGDEFSVSFGSQISRYIHYSIDEGEFSLRDTMKRNSWNYRWWKKASDKDLAVTITVPPEKEYDEVSIDAGEAGVFIRSIRTGEFSVDCGVGEVEIEDVSARTFEVDGGVGEVKARGISVSEKTDLEIGVGEVNIQGDLRGEVDIEGGVGEVQEDLSGEREEYAIEIEEGLGEMWIDGEQISVFRESRVLGSESARNSIKVDCALGEIRLNFGKN